MVIKFDIGDIPKKPKSKGGAFLTIMPVVSGACMMGVFCFTSQNKTSYIAGSVFLLTSCIMLIANLFSKHKTYAEEINEMRDGFFERLNSKRESVAQIIDKSYAFKDNANPLNIDIFLKDYNLPLLERLGKPESNQYSLRYDLTDINNKLRIRYNNTAPRLRLGDYIDISSFEIPLKPYKKQYDKICYFAAKYFSSVWKSNKMPYAIDFKSYGVCAAKYDQYIKILYLIFLQSCFYFLNSDIKFIFLGKHLWLKNIMHSANNYLQNKFIFLDAQPQRFAFKNCIIFFDFDIDIIKYCDLYKDNICFYAVSRKKQLNLSDSILYISKIKAKHIFYEDISDKSLQIIFGYLLEKYKNNILSSSVGKLGNLKAWFISQNRKTVLQGKFQISLGLSEAENCLLDFCEAACGGDGPHGVLIGATGCGKSELLKTIILSLAMQNSPEVLNFLLIDFKGGSAFSGLKLPHISKIITNLSKDRSYILRLFESLKGEIARRQNILLETGGFASIFDYLNAGHKGMAYLFIIVDEFLEFLNYDQSFIDIFINIARVGRSLGVYLLFSSQSLEISHLKGLEKYLSYRICLRTFLENESYEAIGSKDAYYLPKEPGWGYLKTASGLQRFKSQISGNIKDSKIFLQKMRNYKNAAHKIWLDPLTKNPPLYQIWRENKKLNIAFGIEDKPFEQKRDIFLYNLSNKNLLLVGGVQSGKSMALLSLVLSLCYSNSPNEAEIYIYDGDFKMEGAKNIPHIVSFMAPNNQAYINMSLNYIYNIFQKRQEGTQGIDRHIFFVIDNLEDFCSKIGDKNINIFETIAKKGLGVNIHIIASNFRHFISNKAVNSSFNGLIELRLSDSFDSQISKKMSQNILDIPGYALNSFKHHMIFANPISLFNGLKTEEAIRRKYPDFKSRVLPHFPHIVNYKDICQKRYKQLDSKYQPLASALDILKDGFAVGLKEDFSIGHIAADNNILVSGLGISNIMQVLALEILKKDQNAKVLFIDPRLSSDMLIKKNYIAELNYVNNIFSLDDFIKNIAFEIENKINCYKTERSDKPKAKRLSKSKTYIFCDDYFLYEDKLNDFIKYFPYLKYIGVIFICCTKKANIFNIFLSNLKKIDCIELNISENFEITEERYGKKTVLCKAAFIGA